MNAIFGLRRDGRWFNPHSGRLLRRMQAGRGRYDKAKPIRYEPPPPTPATTAREAIREYRDAWRRITAAKSEGGGSCR